MMGAAIVASSPDDHSDDHEHISADDPSLHSDKYENDSTDQFVKDIEGGDNASDSSNNKDSCDLELDINDDESTDNCNFDSKSYSRQNSEEDIKLTQKQISADHPDTEESDQVAKPNNCRLIINYKHCKESPLCEMDPKVDVYIAKDGKLPINCLQISYV